MTPHKAIEPPTIHERFRHVGYFPSLGIHAQNYYVADIPAGKLSHIIYAFADVAAAGDRASVNVKDNRRGATKQPEQAAATRRSLAG